MNFVMLAVAIAFEVAATLMLKASDGLTRWPYAVGSILSYCVAGALLSLVLRHMNVGIVYSVWAGSGIALICVSSAVIWGQRFDAAALIGIGLIVAGVAVLTLKSGVLVQ